MWFARLKKSLIMNPSLRAWEVLCLFSVSEVSQTVAVDKILVQAEHNAQTDLCREEYELVSQKHDDSGEELCSS